MISKSFIDANCIYPDFPKPGIKFVDIFPCMEKEPLSLQLKDIKFEGIVLVPEARGFLFYNVISAFPKVAVVPLRKANKMPGKCIEIPIVKEYGMDILYLQVAALSRAIEKVKHNYRSTISVMVFDDVLATGGTVKGIADAINVLQFMSKPGGMEFHFSLDSAAFYMELEFLKGRDLLTSQGISVQSVIKY